ncbi:hypothetical protein [Rubripirellula amarantea]|uniref:hypothetical protein n=1 Tax=Rubripirellula amarantea TaxID=2527999 RepID=UPI0011B4738D|nr:hypothetical protein [Rubripirellula amarantea]
MNLWISRIALVAYLIGGWLLPAVHRHGHVHDGGHCGTEVATVGFDSTEDSGATDHTCSCTHHVCDSDDDSASSAADADATRLGFTHGHHVTCDGLCAICIARTLVSSPVVNQVNATALFVAHRTSLPPPVALVDHSVSQHSPRGPPQNV